jgi:hypothetical protein
MNIWDLLIHSLWRRRTPVLERDFFCLQQIDTSEHAGRHLPRSRTEFGSLLAKSSWWQFIADIGFPSDRSFVVQVSREDDRVLYYHRTRKVCRLQLPRSRSWFSKSRRWYGELQSEGQSGSVGDTVLLTTINEDVGNTGQDSDKAYLSRLDEASQQEIQDRIEALYSAESADIMVEHLARIRNILQTGNGPVPWEQPPNIMRYPDPTDKKNESGNGHGTSLKLTRRSAMAGLSEQTGDVIARVFVEVGAVVGDPEKGVRFDEIKEVTESTMNRFRDVIVDVQNNRFVGDYSGHIKEFDGAADTEALQLLAEKVEVDFGDGVQLQLYELPPHSPKKKTAS